MLNYKQQCPACIVLLQMQRQEAILIRSFLYSHLTPNKLTYLERSFGNRLTRRSLKYSFNADKINSISSNIFHTIKDQSHGKSYKVIFKNVTAVEAFKGRKVLNVSSPYQEII